MYNVSDSGSTATASWVNRPIAGRATAGFAPVGSHSHTRPVSLKFSSPDNQVPQGVGPPPQFEFDPSRIR